MAVFPLAAGSEYSTLSTTWFGGVTAIGLLLNTISVQSMPSLRYFQASPTCSAVSSYCSKVVGP